VLKAWRPRWFSGLGLVLGSLAPDLEFIVPVSKEMYVGHTILGQLVFTVPVALLLYLLSTDVVFPWIVSYLPRAWWDLTALKSPRGMAWAGVAFSAFAGGLTHIFLDGFTHNLPEGGWALAFLPWLGWGVPTPFGAVAFHDLLQVIATVLLGVMALRMWGRILDDRLLRIWRGGTVPLLESRAPRSATKLLRWLGAAASLGIAGALLGRPGMSVGQAVEFASYGLLDGLALGVLLPAVAHRVTTGLRRSLPRRAAPAAS
jgi:membrane-bound metal-dependent hydrolase YbcI (DUF457 family)